MSVATQRRRRRDFRSSVVVFYDSHSHSDAHYSRIQIAGLLAPATKTPARYGAPPARISHENFTSRREKPLLFLRKFTYLRRFTTRYDVSSSSPLCATTFSHFSRTFLVPTHYFLSSSLKTAITAQRKSFQRASPAQYDE